MCVCFSLHSVFCTDFAPSPRLFSAAQPTSTSLNLSWTILYPEVTPNKYCLNHTLIKLSGAPATTTNGTVDIYHNDTGLVVTNGNEYSYVLGDLLPYTEYTFSLVSAYGATVKSDEVTASANTSESSK